MTNFLTVVAPMTTSLPPFTTTLVIFVSPWLPSVKAAGARAAAKDASRAPVVRLPME
ncbi:hypothetical protein ACFWA5_47770 [Streptomyces mirabilis]|uniref:hypothetical protein n=1 Tax=Streptomyces mirabilis TaxID=68239 RepID=UPI00364C2FCE